MSMQDLISITRNFCYNHNYLALAIGVGLILILYHNPKDTLKILGGIVIFFLIIYGFSILGKTSSTGLNNEKQMINQTVNRMK